MRAFKVLIKEGVYEFEQIYNVPDALDPEITIRTNIKMFNRYNRRSYEFIKIVRTRKENGRNIHSSKTTKTR